jgi:hypothetical protein
MKTPNTTVTLPKIAAAIAAALAVTATVLAIPALAQATSTPTAKGFTEKGMLPGDHFRADEAVRHERPHGFGGRDQA